MSHSFPELNQDKTEIWGKSPERVAGCAPSVISPSSRGLRQKSPSPDKDKTEQILHDFLVIALVASISEQDFLTRF